MTALFADTSYFVAFLSRRDEHHVVAKNYFATFEGKIVTTRWVLLELANYFSASTQRQHVSTFLRGLDGDFRFAILPADESSYEAGMALYDQHRDKLWSLTDCISFHVMRRDNILQALTADHHFVQAGFTALLLSAGR